MRLRKLCFVGFLIISELKRLQQQSLIEMPQRLPMGGPYGDLGGMPIGGGGGMPGGGGAR